MRALVLRRRSFAMAFVVVTATSAPTSGRAGIAPPAQPVKAALHPGAPPTSKVSDLVVVVHRAFPGDHVEPARLQAIFAGSERKNQDGKPIIVFNYPPEDKLRVAFDWAVLHMTAAEVSRYWIDQRRRVAQPTPRQISDPKLMLRLVGRLPGSIGYLPESLIDASVRVVARIRSG